MTFVHFSVTDLNFLSPETNENMLYSHINASTSDTFRVQFKCIFRKNAKGKRDMFFRRVQYKFWKVCSRRVIDYNLIESSQWSLDPIGEPVSFVQFAAREGGYEVESPKSTSTQKESIASLKRTPQQTSSPLRNGFSNLPGLREDSAQSFFEIDNWSPRRNSTFHHPSLTVTRRMTSSAQIFDYAANFNTIKDEEEQAAFQEGIILYYNIGGMICAKSSWDVFHKNLY